ncbi:FMN-binding protein [Verrucomicrobiota bacterium]
MTDLTSDPGKFYPVVYMFVVMFCFTAVLVGLARSASDRIEANREVMFEKAVLTAVGIDVEDSSPTEVHAAFTGSIRPPTAGSSGAYVYVGHGQDARATGSGTGVSPVRRGHRGPVAYAIPFEGQGFWNTIKGVIGVKPDGRTIAGIAFYEQSETPGLGAEIVKPRFCDQFKGLLLEEGPAPLSLKPAGAESEAPGVQAITGATQTCTRLERILNDALREWRQSGVRRQECQK